MSWLGGSISSLTGQLSNLTKDILTEGTEEIDDPATELRLAKEKIEQQNALVSTQRQENERLKHINKELEEKAESSELQINTISREYRGLLESKEKEINTLKQQHQELLEQQARSAALSLPTSDSAPTLTLSSSATYNQSNWTSVALGGEEFPSFNERDAGNGDWDFDDSIRLQRENNSLRAEVLKLQSEAKHWRSVAGQLGQNVGQSTDQPAPIADILELQQMVKSLEAQLASKRDELQQQAASLHEHHRQKISNLKSSHTAEIDALKLSHRKEIDCLTSDHKREIEAMKVQHSFLEQQLREVHDIGSSSQHSGSVNLPESDRVDSTLRELQLQGRLSEALHEKEELQNAHTRLESVLAELQQRIDQQQPEKILAKDEYLEKIAELTHHLQESETLRATLERELKEKNQLTQSLLSVKEEQEEVLAKTEAAIEKIGDRRQKETTTELLDALEKENILLKEEKLKYEEQITLLERMTSTSASEKHALQRRVTELKSRLRNMTGDDGDDNDSVCTEDMDLLSENSDSASSFRNAALHVGQEQVEEELTRLKVQLEIQTNGMSALEMERTDWLLEREALEDVITDLRQKSEDQEQELRSLKSGKASASSPGTEYSMDGASAKRLQALEEEIASLKEDKNELENSLEELDTQHSQAQEQLIKQRDQLMSQLADRNSQIQQQQEDIDQLNTIIADLKKSGELPQSSDLQQLYDQLGEKCRLLEDELNRMKSSSGSPAALEKEITELREKLHKGGLVINDLHMDKQELAEELRIAKEEISVKVMKLKEAREEIKNHLKEKKCLEEKILEMEDRLSEMEEEVDKWQQVNEDKQVQQLNAGKVKEECDRLKSQVARMEKEKQVFSANFESLLREHPDDKMAFKDDAFGKILAEEARVRKKIEEDGNVIQELKGEIQKLYENKQLLKKELREFQNSQEASIAKITQLENEEKNLRGLLESAYQEKLEIETKFGNELQNVESLKLNLSEINVKLKEYEKSNFELSNKLSTLELEKSNLIGQLETEQKHQQTVDQMLETADMLDGISHEAREQHIKEINSHKIEDKLKNNLEEMQKAKNEKIQNLNNKITSVTEELPLAQSEITRLESLCLKKDVEICELKEKLSQFDTIIAENEHCKAGLKQFTPDIGLEISRKSNTLQEKILSWDQTGRESFTRGSQQDLGNHITSSADNVNELKSEIERLKQQVSEYEHLHETIRQLEEELTVCNETIARLHKEIAQAQETIKCHEAGIADLNEKVDTHFKHLQQAQMDAALQKNNVAVLQQMSAEKEAILIETETKMNFLISILTEQQMGLFKNYSIPSQHIPALECKKIEAIEFHEQNRFQDSEEIQENENSSQITKDSVNERNKPEVNGSIIEDDFDSLSSSHDRFSNLEKELDELQGRLKEKDVIIAELQKSNASLLALLEKGGGGLDKSLASQVSVHKLEMELRNLKMEREQMMAVVTEKSRENSSLKTEVHRLMDVVTAGQAAIDKLQQDNRSLEQRQNSPLRENSEEDDMRREALANMARLVRDRETEIEALKQKNETLLAVLQESGESQAAAHLGPLLRDKETLTQQLSSLASEREQLISCVTQKHSESLAYHAEIQRLSSVLLESQEASEKLKKEYSALIPAFEDKSQALITTQNELIQCKHKLSQLEVRHGELIQKSSSHDLSACPELDEKMETLRSLESDLRATISQQEEKVYLLNHRISTLEDSLAAKDNECSHLKKQIENTKFQLTGLLTEVSDLKAEREQIHEKTNAQDTESASLRESYNKMTLETRDKDNELSSLKEQVVTLTSLLNEQQGEHGQVSRLMRENEMAVASARQLQQERDQLSMMVEQKMQECSALKKELSLVKEKELKLNKELQRLRGHLLEIEDGFTKDALESEEREKDLRNRLAVAEEQLMSSSLQVEMASKESRRLMENLQQQLQQVASQRDSAYMQVANIQDQCQQYASSLSNLQLVLEHFQKEKDTAIALETEHLQNECKVLKIEMKELQAELEATRGDLTEALDGLEAASRLSEQLDKKEEALAALKEEVQLRENALSEAEEEIRKLNCSTEAKVDKALMHNIVMTWLLSPENKRKEIVHIIGVILSFSPEDFQKIEAAQEKGGLLSGFFRKPPATLPGSPARQTPTNQSFSQLFVKFLEKESSPPPSPVRLPAEAMAAETQQRHKPTFNPFMAPRHVTQDRQRSSTPSSHILMTPDSPTSTPLFSPLTSIPSSAESAILKDVLGKR